MPARRRPGAARAAASRPSSSVASAARTSASRCGSRPRRGCASSSASLLSNTLARDSSTLPTPTRPARAAPRCRGRWCARGRRCRPARSGASPSRISPRRPAATRRAISAAQDATAASAASALGQERRRVVRQQPDLQRRTSLGPSRRADLLVAVVADARRAVDEAGWMNAAGLAPKTPLSAAISAEFESASWPRKRSATARRRASR